MTRRPKPPTSTAPHPGVAFLSVLRQDHARLSRVLREVEAQRARLQSHPADALPILTDAVQYLLDYQHSFHHPREDRLFGELAAARPRLSAELQALGREHRNGLASARALGAALGRARESRLLGRHGARLAHRLQKYVDETREHMRHEERAVFYAQLERTLGPARWRALSVEAASAADPMGDSVHLARRYPHLSAQLGESVRGLSSGTRVGDAAGVDGAPVEWATAFAEACGELLHDGLDVARSNGAAIFDADSPFAAVRALPGVGRRTIGYAMAVAAFPVRIAWGCGASVLRALAPVRSASSVGDAR
jgi:hemerythrin-like domain-containing protein